MKKDETFNAVEWLMLSCLCLVLGCSGDKAVKKDQTILGADRPVVVEKAQSSQRPEWVNQSAYYEDAQGLHFTGGVVGGSDYVVTIRLAKSEAVKNLLESIEIKARSEFSSVMQGNYSREDIGRYVTDAVAWTVENLRVGGIKQKSIYCEQNLDTGVNRLRYNAWVNLEIGRTDYTRAKTVAVEKLLKKAIQEQDAEAKERALEILERLRSEA